MDKQLQGSLRVTKYRFKKYPIEYLLQETCWTGFLTFTFEGIAKVPIVYESADPWPGGFCGFGVREVKRIRDYCEYYSNYETNVLKKQADGGDKT